MRYKKSHEQGAKAEDSFASIIESKGWEITEANFGEQVHKHIDFYIKPDDGREFSVDVKASKRVSRSDADPQDNFIWVEFLNVRGNKGWLYGEADYIAFENGRDFILVNRKELAELCEKLCDTDDRVSVAKGALYKGYSRKGREDLISIIKASDLYSIASDIWCKQS
jgi:hypothetical protein